MDTDFVARAITLKHKPIAGTNAQDSPNLTGNGDLSLAGDFGLFLHFLTLSKIPYFGKSGWSDLSTLFFFPTVETGLTRRAFVVAHPGCVSLPHKQWPSYTSTLDKVATRLVGYVLFEFLRKRF
jgi:hypothetical protein